MARRLGSSLLGLQLLQQALGLRQGGTVGWGGVGWGGVSACLCPNVPALCCAPSPDASPPRPPSQPSMPTYIMYSLVHQYVSVNSTGSLLRRSFTVSGQALSQGGQTLSPRWPSPEHSDPPPKHPSPCWR